MAASRRTQRTILLIGAVLFGVFFLVAFGFRRAGISQEALSIVGGVLAYAFLAAVVAILVLARRRRGGDAAVAAERFVGHHPAVVESVGRPLQVGRPEGEVPSGRGAAQANLMVPVSGPEGTGMVDLVMARIARHWEVLSATLLVDGDRVRLAEGPGEALSEDD
ncbi:MAG TPA: cytochrome c oxidase assembly factor Coa1 family protein [Miltoncostaeaceae bacterium]|jgi:membrane protein implicated in regulation of membrane protease activity|nr:cytochrome c oxidase assembly factor Coa1 family protein [Miltoncostaeaceae bacterium]